MDVREAIKRIKKMRKERNTVLCSLPESLRKSSDHNNDVLAFTTAIEALEKQLPKKPELINNGISVCQECGAKVFRHYDFCRDCGQK